jgi:hypothetical protein
MPGTNEDDAWRDILSPEELAKYDADKDAYEMKGKSIRRGFSSRGWVYHESVICTITGAFVR